MTHDIGQYILHAGAWIGIGYIWRKVEMVILHDARLDALEQRIQRLEGGSNG